MRARRHRCRVMEDVEMWRCGGRMWDGGEYAVYIINCSFIEMNQSRCFIYFLIPRDINVNAVILQTIKIKK